MHIRKLLSFTMQFFEIVTNHRRRKHKLLTIKHNHLNPKRFLNKFIPVTEWLPKYSFQKLFFFN